MRGSTHQTAVRGLTWATLLLLLALAVAAPRPAVADQAPPGLSMKATPAFNGLVKYGEWLPVWVELENGGPGLQAQVEVRLVGSAGTAVFAAPAELPTGSRKRIPVYVLPSTFSHELEVKLVQKEKVLASTRIAVSPKLNLNYFVGLAVPQQGAMSLLASVELPGQPRPKTIVQLSLAELPERAEGLLSFDLLVLNDLDTLALTPGQKDALERWVRGGGRLVIGGGAGALRTAAGLPPSLLPLTPTGLAQVQAVPPLADWAGQPVRVPGPFVMATGELGTGRPLLALDGVPLIVEQEVGSGAVDFVALDLAAAPFDAWSGTSAFWQRLISPGASYPASMPPDMSLRQVRSSTLYYALTNLPSLDLPSVRGLALLLGFYILLVGPVNYAVLRWPLRGRMHWAWLSIPLLTVAFSAGAFGLGYALRGNDVILNRISILQLQPDGHAEVTSYLGLFSPAQQSYEVAVPGGGLLSPLTPDWGNPWAVQGSGVGGTVTLVQGDPARLVGLAVSQWSMQSFAVEGLSTELGRISGDFYLEGEQLLGTVRNDTAFPLQDAVLILGSQFARLGDLAPGQQVTAILSLRDMLSMSAGAPVVYRIFEKELNQVGPNGPPREAQLKQSILESTLQPGGWALDPASSSRRVGAPSQSGGLRRLLLLGWLDQAPSDGLQAISLAGSGRAPLVAQPVKTTALVYTSLPFQLPEGQDLALPAGLLGGTLLEMPVEGGQCGQPGTTAVWIGRGQAVFQFQLPPALQDLQIQELQLFLGTDSGLVVPPAVALYNWRQGAWTELSKHTMGLNLIPEAEQLVSPGGGAAGVEGGMVRVRLSLEQGQSGCYYTELGFSGQREP